MMSNFNSGFLFGFHGLFMLAFWIGILFFVVWAVRTLKGEKLFRTAVTLLVIGVLGWVLIAWAGFGGGYNKSFRGYGKGWGFGPGMMGGFLDCAKDQECSQGMQSMMNRMNQLYEQR